MENEKIFIPFSERQLQAALASLKARLDAMHGDKYAYQREQTESALTVLSDLTAPGPLPVYKAELTEAEIFQILVALGDNALSIKSGDTMHNGSALLTLAAILDTCKVIVGQAFADSSVYGYDLELF